MTERVTVTVPNTVTPETRAEIERTLEAHARSVIERLGRGVAGYAAEHNQALTLKMARDMFPELNLTRETWTGLGQGGLSRPVMAIVEQWRAGGPTQPPLPDMPSVTSPLASVVDEDEAEGERTCECDSCTDQRCTGDCGVCDNHSCEQCYDGHYAQPCCGYCPECDSHEGDGDDAKCDKGHCHECEHNCRY